MRRCRTAFGRRGCQYCSCGGHRLPYFLSDFVKDRSNSRIYVIPSLDVATGPRSVTILKHDSYGESGLDIRVRPRYGQPFPGTTYRVIPGACCQTGVSWRCQGESSHALTSERLYPIEIFLTGHLIQKRLCSFGRTTYHCSDHADSSC